MRALRPLVPTLIPSLVLLLAACTGALAADPLAKGRELMKAKQYDDAEQVLAGCVAASPRDAACWWELGWARRARRDWEGTVQAWEQVQALDPTRPGLERNLTVAKDNARLAALMRDGRAEVPAARTPPANGVRIRAVGDIMLGTDFPEGCLPPDDGRASLAAVAPLLRDADLTIGNLEGPLCDRGQTDKCKPDAPAGSCYAFRTPTRYGRYLQDAGFDILTTANNHNGDFGPECRSDTEATLEGLGIGHTGRPGDFASRTVNGLDVVVVGFHANEATHDVRDPARAAEIVRYLAARHDLVVVTFHGGAEGAGATHVPEGAETYFGEDRGNLRVFTHAVVDAGADLVTGHGPHVLRAMEIYQDRLIAYSLGNFATYGRFNVKGDAGLGAVLEVTLHPDGRFASGRVLPTRQVNDGIPEPDPDGKALERIRDLSAADFPTTGVQVRTDGTLLAR